MRPIRTGRLLQAFQQSCHCRVQTSGNHLQRNEARFALTLLNVRYVPPVHIQVNREVGLSPPFLFPQLLDSFPQVS